MLPLPHWRSPSGARAQAAVREELADLARPDADWRRIRRENLQRAARALGGPRLRPA